MKSYLIYGMRDMRSLKSNVSDRTLIEYLVCLAVRLFKGGGSRRG